MRFALNIILPHEPLSVYDDLCVACSEYSIGRRALVPYLRKRGFDVAVLTRRPTREWNLLLFCLNILLLICSCATCARCVL
jgi:hypothetical protein